MHEKYRKKYKLRRIIKQFCLASISLSHPYYYFDYITLSLFSLHIFNQINNILQLCPLTGSTGAAKLTAMKQATINRTAFILCSECYSEIKRYP